MALTSERLKALTRQRMDLIKEIDKCPGDASLNSRMSRIVAEISLERHSLIASNNVSSAQGPAATAEATPDIAMAAKPTGNAEVKRDNHKCDDSKKLSDYF